MVCQIRINAKLLSTLYGAFRPIIFEYKSLSLLCSCWSFVKSVIFCWVHSISDLYQYKALVNFIWGLWPHYFLNITPYHCCALSGYLWSQLYSVEYMGHQICIITKLLSSFMGPSAPFFFKYNSLSLLCSLWSFVNSAIFC